MKLSELKNLTDQTYIWAKELEKLEIEKEKNFGFDQEKFCILKQRIFEANKTIEKYSKTAFCLPVSTLIDNLEQIPGYSITFKLTDEKIVKNFFTETYICYFSFFLMKDGKNVGELFSNYYDTDYNEELNNYIRTSKNIRNYFNVGYLIKSANMFAKNYNPEITEFLEKPEVQNALWQTVSENIKNIKQEKLAKKQADVEIYKHKLNEAKAEFKALQTECNALQENLNNDDLTF